MIDLAKKTYSALEARYPLHAKVGRYIVSGGCGVAINIAILFLCVHVFHFWYIASSILAFTISFMAGFMFQKFWTFKDAETKNMHGQAALYLAVALMNLGLNTLIVYLAVGQAGLNYLLAQIVASALIACESYFLYRLIFKPQHR